MQSDLFIFLQKTFKIHFIGVNTFVRFFFLLFEIFLKLILYDATKDKAPLSFLVLLEKRPQNAFLICLFSFGGLKRSYRGLDQVIREDGTQLS